jgi:hypothetical protein
MADDPELRRLGSAVAGAFASSEFAPGFLGAQSIGFGVRVTLAPVDVVQVLAPAAFVADFTLKSGALIARSRFSGDALAILARTTGPTTFHAANSGSRFAAAGRRARPPWGTTASPHRARMPTRIDATLLRKAHRLCLSTASNYRPRSTRNKTDGRAGLKWWSSIAVVR